MYRLLVNDHNSRAEPRICYFMFNFDQIISHVKEVNDPINKMISRRREFNGSLKGNDI